MKIIPVILCGGTGSRLWPLSRAHYPKQFIRMINENSMLQETISRVLPICDGDPLLICNEDHRFTAAEQVLQMGINSADILLEPSAKNTAPAVASAAYWAVKKYKDAVLLILPADHYIKHPEVLQSAVKKAQEQVQLNKLVTFGISVTAPETGYGYIQKGATIPNSEAYEITRFVEKPNRKVAEEYLSSGDFLWNSGMFMFKASVFLDELEQFEAQIAEGTKRAVDQSNSDLDFVRLNAETYASIPSQSIDYGVMERTSKGVVLPLDCGWSDVGSWSSLWSAMEHNEDGNVLFGDVISEESTNNYVHSKHRLTALVGVDNLAIIDTQDALLVINKAKDQQVKTVVEHLERSNRSEIKHHREVYRPWGAYDSVDNGKRYQVKRITVKPGAKLSVQMHHHRAEHWIVVSGTAKVTINDETFLLTENESTYIPIGAVHSLENPGKLPLEMIEVQSGAYLGEDDIVRFEDKYGRA